MSKRPQWFDLEEVKAGLREQGVSEDSIGPTISFMRLVIPLVIREVGVEGIVEFFEKTSTELGLQRTRAKQMAPYVVQWASTCIEKYKSQST